MNAHATDGTRTPDAAQAPAPSVGEIIDRSPVGGFQKTVFALCILTSLLDGFDTQAIAFVAPKLREHLAIAPMQLGILFAATLLGSVLGSSLFGVLADRYGRRRLVIGLTAWFGIFSGACAFAANFEQMLIYRLLGGIGMGGVIPNMLALAAEYAPASRRTTITTYVMWGFPAGAVLGGIASGPLVALYGWPSVFLAGGVAPLLLAAVMLVYLPESLRFLALDASRRDAIVRLLSRIDRDAAPSARVGPEEEQVERGSIPALFKGGLAPTSALMSTMFFLSLFLTYLVLNWVPSILAASGIPLSQAILGAAAVNLGGIIGSYAISRLADARPKPAMVLGTGYFCAAAVIALTGLWAGGGAIALILALLFACGLCLIGSQLSAVAYLAGLYPVALRGTGIGFVNAVGRIGSLVGPLAGGALIGAGYGPREIFFMAAIPAILAGVALFSLAAMMPARSRD
jgi:AAHS family 4-hydroxybenzoate transporter-like MFS transporter